MPKILSDKEKKWCWETLDLDFETDPNANVSVTWNFTSENWYHFAKELKQWVLRLQNQNVSTCMFCGAESLPPNSKDKFLVHIAECPLHPLYQVKQVLTAWSELKGHDRCWHHPEILQKLCEIMDISTANDPCLPSRSEFEQGCQAYQNRLYNRSETR